MTERRLSLGINVSILVILTIFGVLLSLPLRLLLDTSYNNRNRSNNENDTIQDLENITASEIIVIPIDHRKLEQCPRLQYEERLKSVFQSDYDGNCTYLMVHVTEELKEKEKQLIVVGNQKDGNGETSSKQCEEEPKTSKEIVVAGHILVTMLLASAITALVEVLRIRFAKDKDSSRAGSSRKGSTIDPPSQKRLTSRQPLRIQRSFEMQGMYRSALRLLGARPPPLFRRSSFPTQQVYKQNTTSVSGTPISQMARRQSIETEGEIGVFITALHHRTRLIRRH